MTSGGFAVRVGDLLAGRYRLDRRLGAGGMGEVWRGHDLALDRAVAVKVLLEAVTNEEVIARFRREATIGARLQHPGITVVHDVGRHEGRLFIVMELLSGEDLAAVLDRERGGLAPDVAVELAAQTAEALAAAHERSVVHRDLKPPNLFLLPGGRLKICDFGIAYSADATAGWTVTGRIFGTPPYMAPEQWRGGRVDARCDLYALGCVLYALLSGAPPFGSSEPLYVLMRRHVEDVPLSLREAGVAVAPDLDRLVLALLAKDPADRPESAAAVAEALRALAAPAPAPPGGARSPDPAAEERGPGPAPGGEPGPPGTPADRERPATGGTRGPTAPADGTRGPDTSAGGTRGPDTSAGGTRGPAAPAGGTRGLAAPAGGAGAATGGEPDPAAPAARTPAPDTPVGPDWPGPDREAGTTGPERPAAGGGQGPGASVGGGMAVGVGEFVRELLREAEADLREAPPSPAARVEVLAVAADAAARFDAGLAHRLLADAELAALSDGDGDGARVARLLTGLARDVAPHAPARAVRLLAEAHQALFTVSAADRQAPLRAVAEELARLAPERAAQLTGYHFAEGPAENRLRALIATAVAAARPEEAERRLARIQDPGARAAATYDLVLALAPRDLDAALRLSERTGSAGARLLVLCQVAQDRAAAGDPAGGGRALEQAEAELPEVLEERAAWLHEEAAREDVAGRLGGAGAERLRTRAVALLARRPGTAGDEKADHALASLAAARDLVEQGARPALDPVRARTRAGRARELPDPADRARALARIARDCVAAADAPWLGAVADDPGRARTHANTAANANPDANAGTNANAATNADRPARPPRAAADGRLWRTAARPDALYPAGDAVLWRAGAEVGCVAADTGAVRWSAFADEGVPAVPFTGRLAVDCAADAASVYVSVAGAEPPAARLLAREPRDGRVRWWRDWPAAPRLYPAGELLLAAVPGRLAALRADSGEELWVRPLDGDPADPAWSLTVAADRLVLGDAAGRRGLRLRDAAPLWAWARSGEGFTSREVPGGPARTGPGFGGGLVHLLDAGTVRAVRGGTGEEVWSFAAGVPAPRLLVTGGAAYVAGHRRDQGADVVWALDARSGAVFWQRPLVRREGTDPALGLLGVRAGGLTVLASLGGRRGLLGKALAPYVAVLDLKTGRVRGQWEEPALGAGNVLLAGELLVLARPELAAYARP
ncbi:protein kinase [Streptomyces sp. NPDC029003]|uniref:protein kinase domain-containing protein n=1 Tax=Streptomyces sp. NPDC029003 TaxID=3155125 RepID=UPI00340A8C6E